MRDFLNYKNAFRILKGGKISLIVSAFLTTATIVHASPTGGNVTSGTATISQSGNATNINQSTNKASINWQNFSIGANEIVNFNQPSSNSVTLNRVVGTSNSLIQGAMNANGQVILVNPNGVVFTEGSEVNVGGLVATTKNITDENFQNGNYKFEGDSNASILNKGTINAKYVAMMGKTVQNEGTITATLGKVELAGGNKFTLNLNGDSLLKLTIDEGTLNALVENKGLIKADGGIVHLTTQALNSILDGVVNNTGIIEAQTLSNQNGEIVLYAHGGTANIGGTIKAEGGFVETSGKDFKIQQGSVVKAKSWLIDPVNITIDSTLAGTISTALGSGNVTITTAGSNTPSTTSGESGTDGDIFVNSSISWSANNTLTLSADRNINVNDNITHTGTSAGGIIFLYGQGTADGGSSTYTLQGGKTVTSPSIQWRKGSDLASTRYAIVDGNVFLGGKYMELGINPHGGFGTGSVKPSIFFGRHGNSGIGMVGDADGFGTGADLRIDYFMPGTPFEGFNAVYTGQSDTAWSYAGGTTTLQLVGINSSGKVEAKTTSSTGDLQVLQTFTIGNNDKYFNNTVQLSNTGSSTINGAKFARSFDPDNTVDVGGNYTNIQKIESTIASDGAAVVSATSLPGDAYATLSGGSQSKIVYYSTDSNVKVGYGNGFFMGDINTMLSTISALSKGSSQQTDAGIGLVYDAGNISVGGSKSFNYSMSLDNRDMATILSELNLASGGSVTPAPTTDNTKQKVNDIITNIVNNAVKPNVPTVNTPVKTEVVNVFDKKVTSSIVNNTPSLDNSKSLGSSGLGLNEVIRSVRPETNSVGSDTKLTIVGETGGEAKITTVELQDLVAETGGEIRVALSPDSFVELVNGGVTLPKGVSQEFYVVEDKK